MSKRPNIHPLYLPTEFYLAISDVQSKMRIGKSAAILLMIAEGLHKHELLDEKTYEIYVKKYTRPLMDIVAKHREERISSDSAKIRCSFGSGSSRCRRLATVTLQKGNKLFPSCPEHLDDFLKFRCERVKEV